MKKTFLLSLLSLTLALPAVAQSQKDGGITPSLLEKMRATELTSGDRALQRALAKNDINTLALKNKPLSALDTHFSHKVLSKGITNQQQSGRCWLFTGMNVLRSHMMRRHHLGEVKLSQGYLFFYDQLEKANLFLEEVLATAGKPWDDKRVEWLFQHPLSDGGQFTGVADLASRYGVVPAEAMPETYAGNSTSRMSRLLSLKLREGGLKLRKMAAEGKKSSREEMERAKEKMLMETYHILTLFLGTPPQSFTWAAPKADGTLGEEETLTPKAFYDKYVGLDLQNNYVMLMNDPLRPYYKTYEIDLDRHVWDGRNWVYLNLPVGDIKQVAIRSIKDSVMMYFSCDVDKYMDQKGGTLDMDNYLYDDFLSTTFNMSKEERVRTFASLSSHAMTLMAVDLDGQGTPRKWMVENSWGETSGWKGHLIMTDKWFDEYMFRLVAEKKYLTPELLRLMEQKPTLLPPWDPMFLEEE